MKKNKCDGDWVFTISSVIFFVSLCYLVFKDAEWEWDTKHLFFVIPYALMVAAFAFISTLFGVGASSFFEKITKKFKAKGIAEKVSGAAALFFVGVLFVFWVIYCIHGHLFGRTGSSEPDATERYDNRLP